jgi:protein-disulfide isomerase
VPADIAAMDPRLQEMVAHFFTEPKNAMRLGPDLASSGPANAPVTMVEFSDYQCSHCKHAAEGLPRIFARYPGKIRLINRHYPLSSECNRGLQQNAHPAACEAARLAYCAVGAGKFAAVHDSFFRHQEELAPERLSPFLEEAGADAGALYKCSDTQLAAAALQRDVEEGLRLNVESTPTFFINGRMLAGFYPEPFWFAVLDRVVAGDERVPPFNPPPPGTSLFKK